MTCLGRRRFELGIQLLGKSVELFGVYKTEWQRPGDDEDSDLSIQHCSSGMIGWVQRRTQVAADTIDERFFAKLI